MTEPNKLTINPIDAVAAGQLVETIFTAAVGPDKSGLDATVKALNLNFAQYDLEVVATKSSPAEHSTKYLRAERIAYLLNMDDFFRVSLQPQDSAQIASALIDRESRLPSRQPGDSNYAPPYDGTDASIEVIRAKDRDYYKGLMVSDARARRRRSR